MSATPTPGEDPAPGTSAGDLTAEDAALHAEQITTRILRSPQEDRRHTAQSKRKPADAAADVIEAALQLEEEEEEEEEEHVESESSESRPDPGAPSEPGSSNNAGEEDGDSDSSMLSLDGLGAAKASLRLPGLGVIAYHYGANGGYFLARYSCGARQIPGPDLHCQTKVLNHKRDAAY